MGYYNFELTKNIIVKIIWVNNLCPGVYNVDCLQICQNFSNVTKVSFLHKLLRGNDCMSIYSHGIHALQESSDKGQIAKPDKSMKWRIFNFSNKVVLVLRPPPAQSIPRRQPPDRGDIPIVLCIFFFIFPCFSSSHLNQ